MRIAPQAPKMVKAPCTRQRHLTTDARASQDLSVDDRHPDLRSSLKGHSSGDQIPATDSFDIGSFDLVRQFVEHVVAKNAAAELGNGHSSQNAIDWEAVEAAVAGSRSFEQAIGRAVVMADQMCRGVFDDTHLGGQLSPSSRRPVPRSHFSPSAMADVVPDFGDESRYRTRMARKVARIFGEPGAVTMTMIEGRAR